MRDLHTHKTDTANDFGTETKTTRSEKGKEKPNIQNSMKETTNEKAIWKKRRKKDIKDLGNIILKKCFIITTWNVRSTNEDGTLNGLAIELDNYNIDMVGLQKTKQRGREIKEVEIYIIFKSVNEERSLGTDLMTLKNYKSAVMD